MNPDTKKLTVYISKDLHTNLKTKASSEEKSISDVIREAIKNYLK
jgi:predicted HicB family RNase H-like nuclease